MATEILEIAPYAPPANVVDVIRHVRKRGLQETLTSRVLTSIGVPDGNVSRTLAAFRFLKLIEEDGECTTAFQRLARASDDEYPEQLAQVIREAYKTVFQYVDPTEDEDTVKLNNVFRQHFNPQAQRTRMVTLFLGLCREAGMISGTPPEPRRSKRAIGIREPAGKQSVKNGRASLASDAEPVSPPQETATSLSAAHVPEIAEQYALCLETLKRLPTDQRWTARQRMRWLQAITANVDLLVEIIDEMDSTEKRASDSDTLS